MTTLLSVMSTALVVFWCSIAFIFCITYYWERCRRKVAEASLADIKRALDLQIAARSAERTGRIRVEVRQYMGKVPMIFLLSTGM